MGPGRKPRRPVFSERGSYDDNSDTIDGVFGLLSLKEFKGRSKSESAFCSVLQFTLFANLRIQISDHLIDLCVGPIGPMNLSLFAFKPKSFNRYCHS